MDPVTIAATVTGFLTFIKDASEVIQSVKGAEGDYRLLLDRLSFLQESLGSIRDSVDKVNDIEAEISEGPFGEKRTSNTLFQRYRKAVEPGGLYSRAKTCLNELKIEFGQSQRKRDKWSWHWLKGGFKDKLEHAVELVRSLREYLHDDEVQLQRETFLGVMRSERSRDEAETINILNWISPAGLQPTDVVASKFSSVLAIPDLFTVSDPAYQQWLGDAGSTHWHLNCFGNPGTGKSHRARTVIHNLSSRFDPKDVPVLFILFNEANKENQSLRFVYRRLLRYLLSQRSTAQLPGVVRELFRRGKLDGFDGPSEVEARAILVSELRQYDRKFLVVDALDEAVGCQKTIHSALSSLRKDAKISIFTTTRLDQTEKQQTSIICDGCGQHTHDLHWTCSTCTGRLGEKLDLCRGCYINKGKRCKDSAHMMQVPEKINIEMLPTVAQVETFVASSLTKELELADNDGADNRKWGSFEPDLKTVRKGFGSDWSLVPKQITEAAGNNYLIADLIVKQLVLQKNTDEARKLVKGLKSTTSSYSELYGNMLDICVNKSDKESQRVAYNHLALVSCAQQPLSFIQLSHAVAIETGDDTIAKLDDRCYSQQSVRKNTNGLLLIGDFGNPEHETVAFFHRTLADYLKENGDRWFPDRHQRMFEACLAYLQLDVFSDPVHDLKDLDKVIEEHPFVRYAACYWGFHLRSIPSLAKEKNDNAVRVLEFLNDEGRKEAATQIALHILSNPDLAWDVQTDLSPLHICAFNGLAEICSHLMEDGEDVDSFEQSYGQTALHYACRNGHVEVVRVLLDENANTNVVSGKDRTPLMEAIERDHLNVADMLLNQASTDVNLASNGYQKWTALTFAAYHGKLRFVERLIEHDEIRINKCNGLNMSALACAVFRPSIECVEVLLRHPEIDLTTRDHKFGTALDYLAAVNHPRFNQKAETIIKMFLQSKAPPALDGISLQHLITQGRTHLINLFLEKQNYFHWRDDHGRSLLHVAAFCSKEPQTLQFIYDHLSKAADFDFDEVDSYGCAPLHAACSRFFTDRGATTRLLLELGADPKIKDSDGQLPIEVAYRNVPRSLVDTVSDTFSTFFQGVDLIDKNPPIPLERIVRLGNTAQLESALKLEPSPIRTSPDPYTGFTILHETMAFSRPDMLGMLLPHTQHLINVTTDFGRTCLHIAVEKNSTQSVELLIKEGADLDVQDMHGDTVLDVTRSMQNFNMAFLLIKSDAKIIKERVHPELLHKAVSAGDVEVVRKLVDAGVDIYHQKNGTGVTALHHAKDLYQQFLYDAKHDLATSGSATFADKDSFEQAARDQSKPKALQEILDCFHKVRRIHTKKTSKPRDLTFLIERLRAEDEASRLDSNAQGPRKRLASDASIPPPYASKSSSIKDFPAFTKQRGTSLNNGSHHASKRPSRAHSPVKASNEAIGININGVELKLGQNERLAVIVVLGVVVIACFGLLLHFGLKFMEILFRSSSKL